MNSMLPPELYSPDQLSAVILELRNHLGVIRDWQIRQKLQDSPSPAPSPSIATLLTYHRLKPTDQPGLEELIKKLENLRVSAPVVHLMFAAPPGSELKQQLSTWFRTTIDPAMLLTFSARRDIGGGLVVRAGSSVHDFSFHRLLLDNKNQLAELFARVQ